VIQPETLRQLLAGIMSCLFDGAPIIRSKAAETLLQLFDPDFVPQWDGSRLDWRRPLDEPSAADPTQTIRRFWRISSQVMLSLGRQILEMRGDIGGSGAPSDLGQAAAAAGVAPFTQSVRYLLELIRELLKKRNEHLRRNSNVMAASNSVHDRFAAGVALEIALLVFLCSADAEVSTCSVQCFGYLVEEAEITSEASSALRGGIRETPGSSVSDFMELQNGVGEDEGSLEATAQPRWSAETASSTHGCAGTRSTALPAGPIKSILSINIAAPSLFSVQLIRK
jgi:hypothetical protein